MKKSLLMFLVIIAVVSIVGYLIVNGKNGTNGEINNEINNLQNDNLDENKVVKIKDIGLEKIVREKVEKLEGDLLVSDMKLLTSLNIDNKKTPVYEIDGLEYAVNLSDFSYRYGTLKSLNPIKSNSKLFYMVISYSKVEQTPDLFNTPVLESVSIIETNLSDCDFLKESKNIINLNLIRSGLTKIEFITNMNNLENLDLSTNSISDISSIKNKTKLTRIVLHQNEVSNIDVLSTCIALEEVNISYNYVSNIKPLSELKNLKEITAYEALDKKIIDRGQIGEFINKGVSVDYHK